MFESRTHRARVLFNDDICWAPLQRCSSPASADFNVSAVANHDIGMNPTGGYSRRTTSITIDATTPQIAIDTEHRHAGEGCMTTQALTYPNHLVKFERPTSDFSTDVEVHRSTVTEECD